MSSDAGAGTPEGGQPSNDNAAPEGKAGTGTGTVEQPKSGGTSDFDASSWESLAKEVGLTPEQIREKLGHARTWEQRAKDNKGAAEQLPTLQQQLDEMRQSLAERDIRDLERAGKLALSQVRTQLSDAGVKADDVQELLDEIEPTRLLQDGEPNNEAIGRIVGALRKAAGRPTPDPDQGKGNAKGPASMNDLIRRAAGVI